MTNTVPKTLNLLPAPCTVFIMLSSDLPPGPPANGGTGSFLFG